MLLLNSFKHLFLLLLISSFLITGIYLYRYYNFSVETVLLFGIEGNLDAVISRL